MKKQINKKQVILSENKETKTIKEMDIADIFLDIAIACQIPLNLIYNNLIYKDARNDNTQF